MESSPEKRVWYHPGPARPAKAPGRASETATGRPRAGVRAGRNRCIHAGRAGRAGVH